jgi:hypothetical protein
MVKEYTGEVISEGPKEYTGDIIYQDPSIAQKSVNAPDIPNAFDPEAAALAEKKYREYESSFGHRAKEAGEELWKMAEGTMGIGPIAEIGAVIPALRQEMPAVAKGIDVAGDILSKGASKVGQTLYDLPLNTQAFISGKPKEELKAMYELGKDKSDRLLNEFNKWANNEFVNIVNRGDYNTAIAEGLPHEIAVQATHRRSDLEKGVWYLKNLFNDNYVAKMGITPKQFKIEREALMQDILPKAMSEAQRLGMKYGDWVPTNLKDLSNLGAHAAGWGGLGTWLLHGLGGLKSAGIPLVTRSPKLNADISIGAGKAARYASKAAEAAEPITSAIPPILKGTKNISGSNIVGGLANMAQPEQNQAKGGPIHKEPTMQEIGEMIIKTPLNLKHVYYHRLKKLRNKKS